MSPGAGPESPLAAGEGAGQRERSGPPGLPLRALAPPPARSALPRRRAAGLAPAQSGRPGSDVILPRRAWGPTALAERQGGWALNCPGLQRVRVERTCPDPFLSALTEGGRCRRYRPARREPSRHLNALEVKFFGLPAEGARTGIQDLRLLGGRDRGRPPLGPRPHGPGPGFGPPSPVSAKILLVTPAHLRSPRTPDAFFVPPLPRNLVRDSVPYPSRLSSFPPTGLSCALAINPPSLLNWS